MPAGLSPSVIYAIAKGGTRGVAYRLLRGFAFGEIVSWVKGKFGFGSQQDIQDLIDLGQQGRDAGAAFDAITDPHTPLDPTMIPIIPGQGVGYWKGARYEWDVEVEWEVPEFGTKGTFRWTIPGGRSMTHEEINNWIDSQMERARNSSPERFGGEWFDQPVVVVNTWTVAVERAY